jgi:hypothetical protein
VPEPSSTVPSFAGTNPSVRSTPFQFEVGACAQTADERALLKGKSILKTTHSEKRMLILYELLLVDMRNLVTTFVPRNQKG